ncbi:ribonuclease H [Candidatus Shapirobacteria bacterium CG09_land_8_20_14_0_10_39_12]|uniref:Ribonuclease H n=1 Tax=Candidatus Shapirobacteria bacterium CG09_land_8_20_14_0_10_39_12 TaxID=1974885 RepID=A0A2H0WQE2_9BACT|nr:MAG: ribonuclease H [Candidatus Shapirobacteria bacterium CG09_land_8_20_14_0_10_39_12]
MNNLVIYTDGGSRGNPGPAAIGIYIVDENGLEVLKMGKQIGNSTNNIAEYSAVVEALKWIKVNRPNNIQSLKFFLDSSLVVNQLNGIFKIKNSKLRNLILKIKILEQEINKKISYHHIPRGKNKVADFLVNNSF